MAAVGGAGQPFTSTIFRELDNQPKAVDVKDAYVIGTGDFAPSKHNETHSRLALVNVIGGVIIAKDKCGKYYVLLISAKDDKDVKSTHEFLVSEDTGGNQKLIWWNNYCTLQLRTQYC